MTTTTTTAQPARDALAQLEAEHRTAAAEASRLQAQAKVAADALAEVERAIRNGDNHLGQVDLLERDSAKRTAALVAEGAVNRYTQLHAQLPAARTDALLEELEADSPLTRMAEADAKLQATMVAGLREWRAVAAENFRTVNAIRANTNAKHYDRRVAVSSSGMLEIEGQGYRDIHDRSQYDWDRNWQATKRVILGEDSAEAVALRAAAADTVRWGL